MTRFAKVITCSVLTVLLFVAANATASADGEKVIAFGVNSWCPHVCDPSVEQGLHGYTTDIVTEIFEGSGYRIEIVAAPFARLVEMSRQQAINLASIYKEEADFLSFAPTPTGVTQEAIFVRRGLDWKFEGPASLRALERIGVISAAKYGDTGVDGYIASGADNLVSLTGVEISERFTQMLMSNRIDAAITETSVMRYAMREAGVEPDAFDVFPIGTGSPLFLGISQSEKSPEEIVSIFEEGIVALRKSGRLEEIMKAYGLKDWHKTGAY